MRKTYLEKATKRHVQLTIQNENDSSVTYQGRLGRVITLSRKQFDVRFEEVDKPAAPASGSQQPQRPSSTIGPSNVELDAKLDDILDALGGINAKVTAVFRVVADQPDKDVTVQPIPSTT